MYNDIIFKLGEFSLEAMIYEVSCFPSFGLVSPTSTGSHQDMNYYTFIDSSSTLYRYLLEMAHIGYSDNSLEEIFLKIREIGKNAEKAMFEKTQGVNTHKGMIFVLGLGITAISKILYDKKGFDEISSLIKKMTSGIVENDLKQLKEKENLTHGEQIFLEYGITGVRGEAETGFSMIFDIILKIYEEAKVLEENQRLSHTLLAIMSHCEDTTILYRHDYDVLSDMRKKSKNFLDNGGMKNKKLEVEIKLFNKYNEENRISPGGCADLLALTIFLSKVKQFFFKEQSN